MQLRNATQTPEIPEKVVSLIQDASKQLYRSPKEQKKCVKALLQSYVDHEPIIRHLTENQDEIPKLLDSLTQALEKIIPQLPRRLTKQTTALALLSLVGKGVAQSNNLTVVTGQVGGNNLCAGWADCIQGAIVNSTNNAVVASFNAFLNLAGKVNLGAIWAFNDCMDPANLGNALKDILVQNATSAIGMITAPCATTYSPSSYSMPGGNIEGQVQNLNVEQCLAYQNSFAAEAQRCMTDNRVIGLNWAVAGIFIAAFVCCAIPVACCCRKNCTIL